MTKKSITTYEFNKKLRKESSDTEVKVKFGDLLYVMKAAKKCIRFAIMSDNFLSSGLAVEDEEMAQAYKNINEYIDKVKSKIKNEVKERLNSKFTIKD
jgi:hypothetical protein